MNQDPSLSPEMARRRGLFSSKGDPQPAQPSTVDRTEAMMVAYHEMIRQQLEEGLRELQHTANQLMHEIASEVWRTAGGDKDEAQSKLLAAISRDQSIRSLMQHTDERMQSLSVRTARLEDTMNMLAEGMRAAREQLARGVDALEDVQSSPAVQGVAEIRERLDEVTRQIATAFDTLAERDRAITESVRQQVLEHGTLMTAETSKIARSMQQQMLEQGEQIAAETNKITESVQQQVRDHGQLVATETARIAEALQGYVQHGVEAMGQLASGVEMQLASFTTREEAIDARIAQIAETQVQAIDERLREISERFAAEAVTVNDGLTHVLETTDARNRSLGELLQLMHERVDLQTRDVLSAIDVIEARTAEQVRGLAELVRSDSLALREEIVHTAAAQDETVARVLDDRLGLVTDTLTSATGWMVEEITRRVRDDSVDALRTRLDEAVSIIDRNMVRMSDSLEGQLDRLVRAVGDRASDAASSAIADTAARTEESITRVRMQTEESITRAQMQTEETLMRSLEARVSSLAKMVRSDNESLARQIVADQEASKQALRAMKELQASLPSDVIETIQRRMDDLAESVATSQEMLAQRIDRMAAKIGERYDNDIQIVIDRMGDAMHALAGLGRGPQPSGDPNGDRIELD